MSRFIILMMRMLLLRVQLKIILLVAISTGLLNSMTEGRSWGGIGSWGITLMNGDMVTVTLLQGVLRYLRDFLYLEWSPMWWQVFVMAMKKAVVQAFHFLVSMVLEILFGILAWALSRCGSHAIVNIVQMQALHSLLEKQNDCSICNRLQTNSWAARDGRFT